MSPSVSIFSFENYRSFLKAKVKADKNSWGLWAKIAKAAGCQATYLTQVIKGKANLTSDHVLGISVFFDLNNDEIDFFLLLLEIDRAATSVLKKFIQNRIKKILSEREDLSKRLALPRLEIGEKETVYYSAWYWSALHIIVTIPEYQATPAIAKRLQLPEASVELSLQRLEQYSIVKKENGKWRLGTADIHIPKTSPLIGVHHNNWRQKAVLASTLPNQNNVHYTAVYSLSKSDFEKLKTNLNTYIEHSRKAIAPSKEEMLVCLACDFFEV